MTSTAESSQVVPTKAYHEPSVFQPGNLLREARRQRGLPEVPVPTVCLLDPDGDVVRHLTATGSGVRHAGWACYHTDMMVTEVGDVRIGVVGCAVGAPFAVLVAEQLAASGAELVVSITSAGQLQPVAEPPYFVLIEAALRDEGTSAHYLRPSTWAELGAGLAGRLGRPALDSFPVPVVTGRSWTTDAPYRETSAAIADARAAGAVCVEMEAAALYAYAAAAQRAVICLAHVTNTMAVAGDDFDKGQADGAIVSLAVTAAVARAVLPALLDLVLVDRVVN